MELWQLTALELGALLRRVDVLVVMNCLLDMDGQVDGLAGVSSDETNVSAAGRDVVPQKSDYTVIPED